jgi:hypothetical protein
MKVIEYDNKTKLQNTLNYSISKGKWHTYTGKQKVSSSYAIYLEVNNLAKLQ